MQRQEFFRFPYSELTEDASFGAQHPMFDYSDDQIDEEIVSLIANRPLVVIGMGGSVLPLKAFVDFFELKERVQFLDHCDSQQLRKTFEGSSNALFFIVSKSGATLEVRAMLAELERLGLKDLQDNLVVVTDPFKGELKAWAEAQGLRSLMIPSEIGGRFTNYTPFHATLAAALGFDYPAARHASMACVRGLKAEALLLDRYYQLIFESNAVHLILFCYSPRLFGFAQWVQQVIAESLAKRNENAQPTGILPVLLQGPQDQHSVLQLLHEGPNKNVLWFLSEEQQEEEQSESFHSQWDYCRSLDGKSLSSLRQVMLQSTIESFVEKVKDPFQGQSVIHWAFAAHHQSRANDLGWALAFIQAFIEFSAGRLKINAFDQPGVERGKQIARELLQRSF